MYKKEQLEKFFEKYPHLLQPESVETVRVVMTDEERAEWNKIMFEQ